MNMNQIEKHARANYTASENGLLSLGIKLSWNNILVARCFRIDERIFTRNVLAHCITCVKNIFLFTLSINMG